MSSRLSSFLSQIVYALFHGIESFFLVLLCGESSTRQFSSSLNYHDHLEQGDVYHLDKYSTNEPLSHRNQCIRTCSRQPQQQQSQIRQRPSHRRNLTQKQQQQQQQPLIHQHRSMHHHSVQPRQQQQSQNIGQIDILHYSRDPQHQKRHIRQCPHSNPSMQTQQQQQQQHQQVHNHQNQCIQHQSLQKQKQQLQKDVDPKELKTRVRPPLGRIGPLPSICDSISTRRAHNRNCRSSLTPSLLGGILFDNL